jgi:hypothetical protein
MCALWQVAGTDYEVSADSHLVIVTAGMAVKPGESRLSLAERNTAMIKNVIPEVLAHSPHAAICIVSDLCDIMTAVAAKVAGSSVLVGRILAVAPVWIPRVCSHCWPKPWILMLDARCSMLDARCSILFWLCGFRLCGGRTWRFQCCPSWAHDFFTRVLACMQSLSNV